MLDFQAARWLVSQEVAPQAGNNHPTSIPTGVFETRDGHINLAVAGGAIWERFCKAVDAEDMLTDPAFATAAARSENRDALNARINEITREKASRTWIDLLNKAGVPCGPMYKIDEVFADPQVPHLGITKTVESAALGTLQPVGQGVNLDRTPRKRKGGGGGKK